MIGRRGERGSGISMLAAWYNDDDDIHLNVCKQMTDVKLLLLYGNIWNHLTVCKTNELRFILKYYLQNVFTNYMFNIYA